MYTTTLRSELPGPMRTVSGKSGLAACICAQAGSFERSSTLGFAGEPLSVTLPVTLVPAGPAKSAKGAQERRKAVNEAYASRIPVKPPELGVSTNRGLAEFLKRGSAEHQQE